MIHHSAAAATAAAAPAVKMGGVFYLWEGDIDAIFEYGDATTCMHVEIDCARKCISNGKMRICAAYAVKFELFGKWERMKL